MFCSETKVFVDFSSFCAKHIRCLIISTKLIGVLRDKGARRHRGFISGFYHRCANHSAKKELVEHSQQEQKLQMYPSSEQFHPQDKQDQAHKLLGEEIVW